MNAATARSKLRLTSPYTFKASPYSSHTLLLRTFPEHGDGRRVLDAGCGEGHLARILAERRFHVTGIERPGCYGEAFPEAVKLIVGDVEDSSTELRGPFDFILCADVLEHLRDPQQALVRLRGLLETGGVLIASLPNSGNIYFRWNVLLGRFPREDRGLFDRTHLHFYTWSGWKGLFRQSDLQIEQVKSTAIPVGLAAPKWERSAIVRLAERLCYDLARAWKTLFAYQFVVTARVADSE